MALETSGALATSPWDSGTDHCAALGKGCKKPGLRMELRDCVGHLCLHPLYIHTRLACCNKLVDTLPIGWTLILSEPNSASSTHQLKKCSKERAELAQVGLWPGSVASIICISNGCPQSSEVCTNSVVHTIVDALHLERCLITTSAKHV
mmetsp:Transcript_95657/g.184514  ORF Transcript_95657/g.184514 Transcript_95657/m.184514 type:complete len:149 (-) Transcript_95657:1183-1629(-)